MDVTQLTSFCDELMARDDGSVAPVVTPSSSSSSSSSSSFVPVHKNEEEPPVTIKQYDIDNLRHFVQIWTDHLEYDQVKELYHTREDPQLDWKTFLHINNLYDVGYFIVKINPQTPVLEFFGLLSGIPWRALLLPGLHQVSHPTLAPLFTEQIAIQLMVLGHHYQFWELISPYMTLQQTTPTTKLLLSSLGTLTIRIYPEFLDRCLEIVQGKMINMDD